MNIHPFKLERYYAQYEFSVKYMLSSSDCESLSLAELLQMASSASLQLWQDLKLGYTETAGHPLLRNEVAGLYQNIPPENVMVAAPEEAIFIAMQTLLIPGDHIIYVPPAYQSLYEIARSIGCDLTLWPLRLSDGKWQLDLNEFENNITPNTRLLVINFPNNPTGYLPSRAEFDAILKIAGKHNLMIFSDEMYRLLESDPAARLPSVSDVYSRGISLSGLSKNCALPGLRIGWLTSQDHSLIDKWLFFKDYTTICNSAPSEILAIIAIQNLQAILERNLAIIKQNCETVSHFFAAHSNLFEWYPPIAGSVAFPRWVGSGRVEDFCQQLISSQGVMLVPGSLFEVPGNHFRLGLGRQNFGEALARVEKFIEKGLKNGGVEHD
jgi:aspartate/methionine/tyrosine aminotransferase